MIKVLLVPSSDYLGHPFPQRHNQIFERLNAMKDFEVHVARFVLFENALMKTSLKVHEIEDAYRPQSVAFNYLVNSASHAFQIKRIVQEEGIDILVLSNIAAPLAYTLIDELSSIHIPIIVDLPDYFPTSASGYLFDVQSVRGRFLSSSFDLMLRRILKHSDLVTVVSNSLEEYALRVGAKKVKQVPNGISEEFLKVHETNDLRAQLGFTSKDFVIGYVGSVEFWLEMDSLVKGISASIQSGVPAKLLLIGKGLHTTYIEKVKDRIEKERISDAVTWHDFIPYSQVPLYLSAIDVGTIPFDISNPTAFYSSPNKMWEYLSQKKPVVSTPIPEAVNNANCLSIVKKPEEYKKIFSRLYNKDNSLLQKTLLGYSEANSRTWANSTLCFVDAINGVLKTR